MFTFKTSLALTVFVLTMVLPCFFTLTFTLVVLGVSALFSALAPALVSLTLFAEMLLPKPSRADERPASVAVCVFCPPTVTTTVLAWVVISQAFRAAEFLRGHRFLPPRDLQAPAVGDRAGAGGRFDRAAGDRERRLGAFDRGGFHGRDLDAGLLRLLVAAAVGGGGGGALRNRIW